MESNKAGIILKRIVLLASVILLLPLTASQAASKGVKAYVLSSDYGSGATISTIKVNKKHTNIDVTADILSELNDDSDIRSYKNYLFVIERYQGDNIIVIKKNDISSPINQYALPEGTNPQDIVFKNMKTAYICGLGSNKIFVVNPVSGKIKKEISLKRFADSNGNAEPKTMLIRGRFLFVVLQRTANYTYSDGGLIAVIDIKKNKLHDVDRDKKGKQAITLSGRNPGFMDYFKKTGKIYVSNAGTYDTGDSYGGIEVVNPETLESEGMLIDDNDLNGSPGSIVIYSKNKGYVTSGGWEDNSVIPFNPSDGTTSAKLSGATAPYIPQIIIDKSGYLYVTGRDTEEPGILIYKARNGNKVSGPTSTGQLPPTGIAF